MIFREPGVKEFRKLIMQGSIISIKGFTLIELLVSVVVFSLGMLAICGMFIRSAASLPELRAFDKADMLGQQTIEQIGSQNCCSNTPSSCISALGNIALLNSGSASVVNTNINNSYVTVNEIVNGISYTVQTIVANATVSNSVLEQVDVVVTWQDRYGLTKTAKYETYY